MIEGTTDLTQFQAERDETQKTLEVLLAGIKACEADGIKPLNASYERAFEMTQRIEFLDDLLAD